MTLKNIQIYIVEFPEGDTHYIIIKGVSPFNSIYIYDMAFRTDPRFESYNSSGYVYKKSTNTLLLKSRHKSEFEKIRLVYRQPAVTPTPAPKVAPAPAPASAETEAPKTEPAVTAAPTETESEEATETEE